jgi:DNA gyrase/topoisomerase IV subunit B
LICARETATSGTPALQARSAGLPGDNFSFDTLSQRLRELAFLNSGLLITLNDERSGKTHEFRYEGGIVEFVRYLNQMKSPLHSKPGSHARDPWTRRRSAIPTP